MKGVVIAEDLRNRYELREERFAHRQVAIELILPRHSDELIDEAEFGADERLPYWADLWPSARALAREILDWTPDRGPHRALELGCGLGLPSLALRSRGAEVVATDYYAEALLFVQENARRNGLDPLETRLLDWRELPPALPRVGFITAADVLYEARNVEPLLEALAALLEPNGTAIVADPGRLHLSDFRRRLREEGWTILDLPDRHEEAAAGFGTTTTVRLLQLSR